MAPDLFSFGPFFLTHIGDIGERWTHHQFGRPDPSIIPAYVHQAYNVTHSLITWAVLMTITVILFRRQACLSGRQACLPDRQAWPMAAWGLHILCDIPTHSTRFFPTPYLWPFHTPFYEGTPWARPPFMLANYTLIALVYAYLKLYRRPVTQK